MHLTKILKFAEKTPIFIDTGIITGKLEIFSRKIKDQFHKKIKIFLWDDFEIKRSSLTARIFYLLTPGSCSKRICDFQFFLSLLPL